MVRIFLYKISPSVYGIVDVDSRVHFGIHFQDGQNSRITLNGPVTVMRYYHHIDTVILLLLFFVLSTVIAIDIIIIIYIYIY